MSVQAIDGAEGLLGTFNEAGVFEASDVHVAQRLTALAKESDESVALAVALVVRALRGGSVCVDLRSVAAQLEMPELPWPSPDDWLAAVQASPLVADAAGAATVRRPAVPGPVLAAKNSRCARTCWRC